MSMHVPVGMDTRRSMPSLSLLLFFILSLKAHLSNGLDSITPTQHLSWPHNLTSQRGIFELGFFTPGKSQNYYIGIWYKQISVQTVVWVANREKPLPNPSNSILTIAEDGNLVLLSTSKFPVWSTNLTSKPLNSTVAILLDNGNLVLRDRSDPSVLHWQSFDHPTHTWLPGGWLGLNKVTKENQRLTSWKNSEDPAPGPFSLSIDPNRSTQYFLTWNGTRNYWTSGDWDGNIFRLVPEMTSNYIYDFSFNETKERKFFTYSVRNDFILSRFVMGFSGQIHQFSWLKNSHSWNLFWSQPRSQCKVYALCGAFGSCKEESSSFCTCLPGFEPKSPNDWNWSSWSGGCKRKTPLRCGRNVSFDGEKDRFWALSGMNLPDHNRSLAVGSDRECELACLNDCSCTAYAFKSRCLIWNGELLDLKQLSGGNVDEGTLHLRLDPSEMKFSVSRKGTVTWAVVGAVAGAVFLLCSVLFFIWRRRWQRNMVCSDAVQGSLTAFSYRSLQMATKNFSEKLGGGGFGSVFKGTLPDQTTVAVKKLEGLRQGEKQFRTEVSTIGTIQHVNLIRLRGFCSEMAKRLLVYDYMPNGSLDSHLFGKNSNVLDWPTRYQIAIATARGISYLHEKCRDCIIHCDIKPENILLDGGFCPKVADFGLAKLVGREFSRVLTTMRGTRGYLAPEWISGLAITPKADVYSYGMMVFEIISGRRNTEQSAVGETVFFPIWALRKIMDGEIHCLLDYRLEGNANMEELGRACRVAGWCIQDDENDRPSMGQVIQILEGVLEANVPPVPRSLQILAENQNVVFFSNSSLAASQSSELPSNSSTNSRSKSVSSASSKE
ncbi:G-type lectin S-receptor-like serine/threonine-protein kinase At2g19130 [Magnolia sinica]|uniref:G-type lectin S-receptor-like serine/threonine-protein kinase At2g19130 n=1 Tax=Magnolia sinica TaxID=86752 RepID=UPI002657E007|nr:G-type lectin S-receptor-like serine/threonine-protein kinase At2g19130 [Magnolia sinica]